MPWFFDMVITVTEKMKCGDSFMFTREWWKRLRGGEKYLWLRQAMACCLLSSWSMLQYMTTI